MFTCAYCGTQFAQHVPNCPNCGAALKAASAPKAGEESLRAICLKYEGVDNLYVDEVIDARRMKTIREQFNIPDGETVLMAYDDTIFSNNKIGFAICAGGLYWKNDWSVTTKRTFLTWEQFSRREISLADYQISLDKGDNLGVAGCGSNSVRKSIEKMLKEMRDFLRDA